MDAVHFAEISERLFRDAFGSMNDPAQMDTYCAAHFGYARQEAELGDRDRVTFLGENGGRIIAYVTLHAKCAPTTTTLPGSQPVEIERFYVDPDLHGTGVAQTLMARAIEWANEQGADVIWLGVWQENPRAIAFYRKSAFEVIGVQIFMLGTEVQHDYVMARGVGHE